MDGSFTESSNEMLELRTKAHFSVCKDHVNEESEKYFSATSITIIEAVEYEIKKEYHAL